MWAKGAEVRLGAHPLPEECESAQSGQLTGELPRWGAAIKVSKPAGRANPNAGPGNNE